ncbi:hypothetical protein AB0U33_24295, partial [Escherichia coli]
ILTRLIIADCRCIWFISNHHNISLFLSHNATLILQIQPLKTRISELDVYESACNEGAGVHDVSRASSLSTAKAQIELVAQEIGIL